MKLHRVYERGPNGERLGHTLLGVEVIDTGSSPEQHFSPDLVDKAIDERWMKFSEDGKDLFLLAYGKDTLHYKVLRAPGCYCLTCKKLLPYEQLGHPKPGEQARAHVATEHGGKSPDPFQPAGYEVIHYYDTVLDAKQHKAHRALRPGEVRGG